MTVRFRVRVRARVTAARHQQRLADRRTHPAWEVRVPGTRGQESRSGLRPGDSKGVSDRTSAGQMTLVFWNGA